MAKPLISIAPLDIPYMKEDRLRREIFSLENRKSSLSRERDRSKMEHNKETIRRIEFEICYLQREVEIREKRKKVHAEFMQKKSRNRARRY